jgi:hypothetical protein
MSTPKITPESARAYLADASNFWPNDELCYVCGDEFDSLAVEADGKIFCRNKCCRGYLRIAAIAAKAKGE